MNRVFTYLTSLAAAAALLATLAAAAAATPLHWSSGRQIDHSAGVGLGTIVCPSASQCDALDDNQRLVQFDPASPSHATRVQITAPAPLTDLTCASATQCTVIDQQGGEATFNPSSPPATLTFQTVDAAVASASSSAQAGAVSCPSSSQCVLVDGAGNVVVFDPAGSSAPVTASLDPGEDFGLVAVTCASASQCTAISQTKEWTFDPAGVGGVISATSATIDTKAGFARAVTCVSAAQCTAVDESGHETTFDPQTATAGAPVSLATSDFTEFDGVACPSATLCVAADLAGHLTSFDPQTGSSVANVAVAGVHDVVCPAATACVADDGAGRALRFTPGTTTRPSATLIDAGRALVSVSCPGRAQCTAVDALHELTFDPLTATRAPLHLRTLPGRAFPPVSAVACPALTLCSSPRNVSQITFNPRSFGRPKARVIDHDGDGTIVTVRCPSRGECVAVDDDGAAVTYDPQTGRIIRRNINVEEVEALTALACPSRSQCTATDNDGTATSFDPLTGHRLLSVKIDKPVGLDAASGDSDNELDGITCRGTRLCVAVDTLGNVVSFDPHSRRGGHLYAVAAGSALTSVVCPTRGLCMLADSSGRVWTGHAGGSYWISTRLRGASALTAIACATGTECVAVDSAGDEFTSH
ncbi:MAG TPA: hypothetical protein VMF07_13175 [Solirubrobacteraceae bacterium]|nr:hypothetical protein [Solirubrobacteraceae bacterium]